MPLTLQKVPGFSDLPDSELEFEDPALGTHVARISENASFGMVRTEIFYGLYKDGDEVPLPKSTVDGYNYSRSELYYFWTLRKSQNVDTNWTSGKEAMWYGAWTVEQDTGKVSCVVAYRYRGKESKANPTRSNDGLLGVYTIAQRRRSDLIISEPPAYSALDNAEILTDVPWNQALAQQLNANAKFGVVSSEIIYMGEFVDGDTVPQPVSPADGNVYAYADVKFLWCWRWTVKGPEFKEPNLGLGILNQMQADISSVGVVSATTNYEYYGVNVPGVSPADPGLPHGRLAVFAFCSRPVAAGDELADSFSEIDSDLFAAGKTLRASRIRKINSNTKEAVASPEFFGPTDYTNGDTVPLPTSPIDGYTYARSELHYIWSIVDTGTENKRIICVGKFDIDQSTGVIALNIWRLPIALNNAVELHGVTIRVLTVGFREKATAAEPVTESNPDDAGSTSLGTTSNMIQIPDFTGGGTGTTGTIDNTNLMLKIPAGVVLAVGAAMRVSILNGHNHALTLTKAVLRRTLPGDDNWIDSTTITWGGSSTPVFAIDSLNESDDIPVAVDNDHDYYIIVYYEFATANNNLVTLPDRGSFLIAGKVCASYVADSFDYTATSHPSDLPNFTGTLAAIAQVKVVN